MKYSWKGYKDRTRYKNRIKRSGQARLVYVKDINRNIPTTCRRAYGDESKGNNNNNDDKKKKITECCYWNHWATRHSPQRCHPDPQLTCTWRLCLLDVTQCWSCGHFSRNYIYCSLSYQNQSYRPFTRRNRGKRPREPRSDIRRLVTSTARTSGSILALSWHGVLFCLLVRGENRTQRLDLRMKTKACRASVFPATRVKDSETDGNRRRVREVFLGCPGKVDRYSPLHFST